MGGIGGYTDPERESYCRDIRRSQTPNDDVQNGDKYNYKVLIDNQEFQSKVLDFIDSTEFDTLFRSSMFNTYNEHENKKNKGAIIHGMMLASMLTSKCKPLCVKEKIEE